MRGTPQQIIEKYNQLARDAQLAGDRVATENFQQHAEHYQRMLSEAMREETAKRELMEQQNRERQAERDREAQERRERQERESNAAPAAPARTQPAESAEAAKADAPHPEISQLEMMRSEEPESGLVETPEGAVEKPKRVRKPRRKKDVAAPEGGSEAAE